MAKMLEIKACKCLLVIPENDLFSGLKSDILQAALQRGKAYRRSAAMEQRQTHIDRWQVYEWLKSGCAPENVASLIETMNATELREGCIEFLLSRKQTG